MLYQLSYTPRPRGELATARVARKVQRMMGSPTQLPPGPVKTRCVAARYSLFLAKKMFGTNVCGLRSYKGNQLD